MNVFNKIFDQRAVQSEKILVDHCTDCPDQILSRRKTQAIDVCPKCAKVYANNTPISSGSADTNFVSKAITAKENNSNKPSTEENAIKKTLAKLKQFNAKLSKPITLEFLKSVKQKIQEKDPRGHKIAINFKSVSDEVQSTDYSNQAMKVYYALVSEKKDTFPVLSNQMISNLISYLREIQSRFNLLKIKVDLPEPIQKIMTTAKFVPDFFMHQILNAM